MIKIGTLNIQSSRNGRLEGALWALQHLNFDLSIFTKTKITDNKYTPLQFGFHTLATMAPSTSQGGVVLFWQFDATGWHLEVPYPVAPNVIMATLIARTV